MGGISGAQGEPERPISRGARREGDSMRRNVAIASLAVVWLGGLPAVPAAAHSDPKPDTVLSWYMNTTNTTTHYNKGCTLGNHIEAGTVPKNAVVILSYGDPVQIDANTWGADLFSLPSVTTGQVRAAMEQYARGVIECIPSALRDHVDVRIGAGVTNNFPVAWQDPKSNDHGDAWASMVNNANNNLPSGVAAHAQIWGAWDMELGFSSVSQARAWDIGYESAPGFWPYFYFGDAAGCRDFNQGGIGSCGTSAFPGWDDEDVIYLAMKDGPGQPLPEIYKNDDHPSDLIQSQQWIMLSKYNHAQHNIILDFWGPLSQKAACDSVGCASDLDNTPTQAWNQMVTYMDDMPVTIDDMTNSCDIDWH
jgi:hypothetical protein